jgi:hypothetical protein
VTSAMYKAWCFLVCTDPLRVVLRKGGRRSRYSLPLTPIEQEDPDFFPGDPGFVVVRTIPVKAGLIHKAVVAIVDEHQDLSHLPAGLVVRVKATIKTHDDPVMRALFLEMEGSPFCGIAASRSLAPYLTIPGVKALMVFARLHLPPGVCFKNVRARKLGYVLQAYTTQRQRRQTVAYVKASPRRDIQHKTDNCQSLETEGHGGESYLEHGMPFANEPWLSYAAAAHDVSPPVIAYDPCCGIMILKAVGDPCLEKTFSSYTVLTFLERYRTMQSKISADSEVQDQVRSMSALQERDLIQAVRNELSNLPKDTDSKEFSRFTTGLNVGRAEELLKELADESHLVETLCHGDLTSSNVVSSGRSDLRCIDWSDAFFGRPYLESLPLNRSIRVHGKQTESEKEVLRMFHETAVAVLESASFVEHFKKARPLRYLRRFVMSMRTLHIDPDCAEKDDLTEDIWEFLVKADKCLRHPHLCVDEDGNLEDLDPEDLDTDASNDDESRGVDGERAFTAVGANEKGKEGDINDDSKSGGGSGAVDSGDKFEGIGEARLTKRQKDHGDAGANAPGDKAVKGNADGCEAAEGRASGDDEKCTLKGGQGQGKAAAKVSSDDGTAKALPKMRPSRVAPTGGNKSGPQTHSEDDDDDENGPNDIVGKSTEREDGEKKTRTLQGRECKRGERESVSMGTKADLRRLFQEGMAQPSTLAITPGKRRAPYHRAGKSNSARVLQTADDSDNDFNNSPPRRLAKGQRRP